MVAQVHVGVGHNIGRDQYLSVYSDLAPADIKGQINLALDKIRGKDFRQAELILDIVKSGATLNSESRAILDMLSINLSLNCGKVPDGAHRKLVEHLGGLQNDIAKDLCFATLIKLECRIGCEDDAVKRCAKETALGVYSREAFYELVSNGDELNKAFSAHELNLSEGELIGVICGALRLNDLDLAKLALHRLSRISSSENCQILSLYVRAVATNQTLLNGQYWYSTKSVVSEILSIASCCAELIENTKGEDSRLFNIAIPMLGFLLYSHDELLAACWRYKDNVESASKEFVAELYYRVVNDSTRLSGARRELLDAEKDVDAKNKVLARVLSSSQITSEDLPLLLALSSKEQLRVWCANGGECKSSDEIEVDSASLLFAIALCSERIPESKVDLRTKARFFCEKHVDKIPELNQFFISKVSRDLFEVGFSDLACDLLKIVLPDSDFWFSPLFDIYINSLLCSSRKKTLLDILNVIDEGDWTGGLWFIKANLDYSLSDFPAALVSVKSAIKLESENIEYWCFAFRLTRDCKDLLEDPLFIELPDKLFSEISVPALQLLHELVRLGRFNNVEPIIIEWFIKDPSANAKLISNFYFGSLLTLSPGLMANVSKSSRGVISAVTFKSGNDSFTKLIVEGEQSNSEFCISAHSQLAKDLLASVPGDIFYNGMNKVSLVEFLPPYVAVLRMSTDIRVRQNDGEDVFYKLELPKDPEKLVPFMEEMFKRQESQDKSYDFDVNITIPMLIKGFKKFPNDPVKAALHQFSHSLAYKHSINAVGEESPKLIAIDIYTICYICLIGMSRSLFDNVERVYVSSNTKQVLDDWLVTIFSDSYLALALNPGGGLIRTTSADIKASDQTFIEGMKLFSERVEILKPAIFDLPSDLMMVRGFVDETICSTMNLALQNEIAWLSIDNQIGNFFHACGGQIVNANKLLVILGASGSYEQKKIGYYMHAQGFVPYVCTWKDFALMAESPDYFSDSTLAKILKLDGSLDLSNRGNFYRLALVVALSVLGSVSVVGGNIYSRIYNEIQVDWSSHVVYAAISKSLRANGKGAEDNFADFYLCVIEYFRSSKVLRQLVTSLFIRFMEGHFLDQEIIRAKLAELIAKRKKFTPE